MGFQVGCIDHDRFLGGIGREAGHDTGEHTHPAPALPPVVERLWRAIFAGCVAPAQAIAIDVYYSAQHMAIIDAGTRHGSWERTVQDAPSAPRSARKNCSSEEHPATS